MEKYNIVAVYLNNQTELNIEIEADEAETTDEIILTVSIDGITFSAHNYGYFNAFQDLRDQLLQKGYGLKCAGANLNAVQSSMASGTDMVYAVALGKQASLKELVSIYDYADISEFPDTKEQNEFFQLWIKSLK